MKIIFKAMDELIAHIFSGLTEYWEYNSFRGFIGVLMTILSLIVIAWLGNKCIGGGN